MRCVFNENKQQKMKKIPVFIFQTTSGWVTITSDKRVDHVQRVSAKHGVKDDFAFPWEHAIFRHPPNKNPLTDRSEILHG
jgi:hypothetical protein